MKTHAQRGNRGSFFLFDEELLLDVIVSDVILDDACDCSFVLFVILDETLSF